MSREKSARKAFYDVLNGVLNVPAGAGSGTVPVSDYKKEQSDTNLYVIIEEQSGRNRSDFKTRRWDATLTIVVAHKQQASITRDIVDDVSDQIESIITPGAANMNGLPAQSGWQITNVELGNFSYADFQISSTETLCIKFLTFNFIITKI